MQALVDIAWGWKKLHIHHQPTMKGIDENAYWITRMRVHEKALSLLLNIMTSHCETMAILMNTEL